MNLNPLKLKVLNSSKIIVPIKPKFSKKANIYFLSKKKVQEERIKTRFTKKISISAFIFLIIAGYFYTN
tara:strand:+ start:100 stop:306 length:207 start_codon:yes stop_codon:yes gene_type:complete